MFFGVQVRRTATQSIPTGTWTAITWQTETGGFDIGSWWSSGTDIVVPAGAIPAGFTTIACSVASSAPFDSNSTGSRNIRVLVNGTPTETRAFSALSGANTPIWVDDVVVVASGDVITVEVDQESGTSLNLQSSGAKVTVYRIFPVA